MAAGHTIRWDRVSRVALLVLLVVVLGLYIGPLRSYHATWQESRGKRAEVARLKSEQARLKRRRAELQDPRSLEREARRLGMVRPGERAYVVRGLPRD